MAAHRGTSERALSRGTSLPFVPSALRTSGGVIHPSVFFSLHQYVFAFVAPPFLSSSHGFHPWVVGSWPSAAALSLCHSVLFFSIKMEKWNNDYKCYT